MGPRATPVSHTLLPTPRAPQPCPIADLTVERLTAALTELQELLDSVAETHAEYRYGSVLAEHIRKIGSTPVRNVRIRFALNEIHLLLRTS